MQHTHDRRVSGVRRVPVERMVDVCGSNDPASAFQGRSVDISGRGMQVRSAHLPELRAPVVLRFEEQGTEVLAEGEVAWRRACASGGEFGVRFTALDSRSVQTLKALCGVGALEDLEPASSEPAPRRPAEVARQTPRPQPAVLRGETDHDTDPAPPAALGVRLHIEGLTAPLHAQIKGQGARSLEVGSQLEFLRVGRSLEIEDLAYGGRRAAYVESVEVSVDQKSRVPELLVSVRYSDSADAARAVVRTPEPKRARASEPERVGAAEPARARSAPLPAAELRAPPERGRPAAVRELDLSTARELRDDESDDDERDTTPPPLPLRVDRTSRASSKSEATPREVAEAGEAEPEQDSTEELLQRLDGVLGGVSVAARAAGAQVARWGGAATRSAGWLLVRARRAMHRPVRPAQPRRRTTAPPRSGLRTSPLRQNPQLALQRPRGNEEPSPPPRSQRSRAVLWSLLVAGVALSIGYLARRVPLGTTAPAASRVVAAPALAAAASEPSLRALAAAPAPASEPAANAAPAAASRLSSAPVLLEEDASSVESIDSARSPASDPSAPGSTRSPNPPPGSEEFGQGRLHLPVIYRLRLDDAGGALRGERTPTGFEITIPGRRVLESGTSISRRDPRIAKVATHNSSQGTRVSFRFRETIPAYKVRLRKDFVEFWISSS